MNDEKNLQAGARGSHIRSPVCCVMPSHHYSKFELPYKVTGARDTRIMPTDSNETTLITPNPHRPELKDSEIFIVPSHADLSVENWSFAIQFYPNSQDQKEWAQDPES
jgi:hypothetical protein